MLMIVVFDDDVDLMSVVQVLITYYLYGGTHIWYHTPNRICNKVGGIDFLLKCEFEMSKIPVKLSTNFHKQAPYLGKMIFTTHFFIVEQGY